MILTSKAKEDFNNWFSENYLIYWNVVKERSTLLHALIIEWFDSVGVYIDVVSNCQTMTFDAYVDDDYIYFYHSRQEATIQAIIKANNIHNERFK